MILPSGGIGGVVQRGDHGEFAPSRVSSHTLNCGGSKVTFPAPRYTYQTTRRPTALYGMLPTRGAEYAGGRGAVGWREAAVAVSCPSGATFSAAPGGCPSFGTPSS